MTTLIVSPQLTLTLYDSIQALPADRYQAARRYEIMAAELPTHEEGLDSLLLRAEQFAIAGQVEQFRETMHNYRLARSLALDSYHPGQLHWAVLVATENGVPITQYDEDSLLVKIEHWAALGLTQQMLQDTLLDVKKNSPTI